MVRNPITRSLLRKRESRRLSFEDRRVFRAVHSPYSREDLDSCFGRNDKNSLGFLRHCPNSNYSLSFAWFNKI